MTQDISRERYLALKAAMMPRDTNQYGTIFGGVLLSYIDLAGASGARHFILYSGWPEQAMVTIAMERIDFKEPVFVGDVVSFWTRVLRVGTSSIAMHISVETERRGETVQVTEADATYVTIAITDHGRHTVPIRGPASEDPATTVPPASRE